MSAHCAREEEMKWNETFATDDAIIDVYLHRKPEKGGCSTSAIFWRYHWHPKLHSFVLKGKHVLLSHLRPQETSLQSKKHRGFMKEFWLTGGYFAAQKHPSSNAFWLAKNFYVEPCKTHKDYWGRVSHRPCATIYTRVAETAFRYKTGISKA